MASARPLTLMGVSSTFPASAANDFLSWTESHAVPKRSFPELKDFAGDAFEHLFAGLTFLLQRDFSLATKHLGLALSKDKLAMARMPEIGALHFTCFAFLKRPLMEVFFDESASDPRASQIEALLKEFMRQPSSA
jgi:hypothetical protein